MASQAWPLRRSCPPASARVQRVAWTNASFVCTCKAEMMCGPNFRRAGARFVRGPGARGARAHAPWPAPGRPRVAVGRRHTIYYPIDVTPRPGRTIPASSPPVRIRRHTLARPRRHGHTTRMPAMYTYDDLHAPNRADRYCRECWLTQRARHYLASRGSGGSEASQTGRLHVHV